jgi:hypothetical protein
MKVIQKDQAGQDFKGGEKNQGNKKEDSTTAKTAMAVVSEDAKEKKEGEQEEEIEKEQTDTEHQHDYKTPMGHDQNATLTPGERAKSEDANKGSHQHGRPPERSEEKQEEEKTDTVTNKE